LAYNRSLALVLCFLFSSNSIAVLKDPTKPPNLNTSSINLTPEVGLQLSAIYFGGNKRATINGITVKEGQVILSSVRILKILESSVKVRSKGIKQTLYLFTPFKKKQVYLPKNSHNE